MAQHTRIIIVPGWRDSGPGHWQTLWQEQLPQAERVVQDDWLTPRRDAWVQALERLIPRVVDELVQMISLARQFEMQTRMIQTAETNDQSAARVLSNR